MIQVRFDKQRAEALVRCLERGEPLPPSDSGWTREDLLMVAGVCVTALMSHGPDSLRGVDPMTIPLEHREAYLATLSDDLALAVRWCAEMTRLAMAGGYDPLFESVHQVQVDGSTPAVKPVSGAKESLLRK